MDQGPIFDCNTALPRCDITCEGPSNAILALRTRQCGCTSEYWFHAGAVSFIYVIGIYAIANFARVLLVHGLCRMSWIHIHNGEFDFIGSCLHDGTVTRPVASEDRDRLAKRLRRDVMKYEALGVMLCVAALAINVPWVMAIQRIESDLAYSGA